MCTSLWREAHFQVKMHEAHHSQTTFGYFLEVDVEKVHIVVARSTFPSQNARNTPFSDHFWKLRCRKSARRCGAKHISKSKCTKHTILRLLLEVEMWKKCTSLWREAHFQVKMHETHHSQTTFGYFWKLMSKKCTSLWREAHFQVKMYEAHHSQIFSDHFWKLTGRKSARRCGAKQISKSKCTKHTNLGPLLEGEMSKKCRPYHAVVARNTCPSQ